MAATVITAGFAGAALLSWKDQKKYDLRINALAKSRLALDLITLLRMPYDYNETSKAMESGHPHYLMSKIEEIDQVLDKKAELYEDILKTKEMVWATLGEKNHYTAFYTEVTDTIEKIRFAHYESYRMAINMEFVFPENEDKKIQLFEITHYQGKEDKIMLNLEKLHKAMIRR